ncbi:hypothetical protein JTE90_006390 [Oedothorax gibbosus]|uniref:Uncharacterized protein n=1 Tax=Oedothorax gibbosus TaxID=931172 RepID=A0AAV6VW65_9ARAC|nr:hypothetical protein JTE90_006390 [Oedothorax gibbosus]
MAGTSGNKCRPKGVGLKRMSSKQGRHHQDSTEAKHTMYHPWWIDLKTIYHLRMVFNNFTQDKGTIKIVQIHGNQVGSQDKASSRDGFISKTDPGWT